jgi:RimJ/RimL family protein N-acetyltransferase
MPAPTLTTPRLVLRHWREADLEPFAALNADPRVMEYFPGTLTGHESDALAARIRNRLETTEFGLWAVEVPGTVPFIGCVGLSVPRWEAHFTPCVEIGWRLALAHWDRGYATEAASAALAYGFNDLKLAEIVSFTATANLRSQAVMQRLGMARAAGGDFLHPFLPDGHPLRPHVLYRIRTPLLTTDH